MSSHVQLKSAQLHREDPAENGDTYPPMQQITVTKQKAEDYDTKIKDVGSTRRNIIRKKTTAAEGNYHAKIKKQGGHGKGQWDDLMDGSLDDFVPVMDENDPLFDATEDSPYILSSGGAGEKLDGIYHTLSEKPIYGNLLTLPEFKIRLMESLREYFDSADGDEVIRSIEELKSREYHPEVVKKAISLALDEGPRERELVSRLLTLLHPTPLSDEDMAAGFDHLLDSLEDLSIDIPDAKVSDIALQCFSTSVSLADYLTIPFKYCSPWLDPSWLALWLMKCYLQLSCRPPTMIVRVIPSSKKPCRS